MTERRGFECFLPMMGEGTGGQKATFHPLVGRSLSNSWTTSSDGVWLELKFLPASQIEMLIFYFCRSQWNIHLGPSGQFYFSLRNDPIVTTWDLPTDMVAELPNALPELRAFLDSESASAAPPAGRRAEGESTNHDYVVRSRLRSVLI